MGLCPIPHFFFLTRDQEIRLRISNGTGQREAMPAREAGVFKM